LNKEYSKIHKEKTNLENRINSLNIDKREIISKINKQNSIYNKKMNILQNIYDKKVNYPMKGKIIAELSQDLLNFGIKVKSIDSKENNMTIDVISNSDKKITNFIKFISHKKSNKYHIKTDRIEKENNTSRYISSLKVVIK